MTKKLNQTASTIYYQNDSSRSSIL